MPSNPKNLTVTHVIEMFEALNLPVTDDGQQIEIKSKELRDFYLREKGSPDGQRRAKADQWFKNLKRLQNDRLILHNVIREHFNQYADTALEAALSAGNQQLTPTLYTQLQDFAVKQCKCDNALAKKFVDEYLKINKLKIGDVFIRPGFIENFDAISGMGQISLKWSLPKNNYDEIEIIREQELQLKNKRKSEKSEIVYNGLDTAFIDRSVIPGMYYKYLACSIYKGVKSKERIARAVCLGEVRNAHADWVDGKIHLNWELPGENLSVIIFRRIESKPVIKQSSHGVEAGDSLTKRIFPQKNIFLEDQNVIEGVTYCYRIMVDYGKDRITPGKDIQVNIPKSPPSVPSVQFSYKARNGKDEVFIEWEPAKTEMNVEYVVVRREGSAPASSVKDGLIIITTQNTHHIDQNIVSGHRYTYAVFTRVGKQYSHKGTTALPIDILAEVKNLNVNCGDSIVELQWLTPANVYRVIIRRSNTPPQNHSDGALIMLTGTNNAKDEGLVNGQCYHYLVCCSYRPDGVNEVFSSGVRIDAIPDRLPDPIKDFMVQVEGKEVLCSWTAPEHGYGVVIRSVKPHELQIGHRLAIREIDRLGERIPTETGRALDVHPEIDKPYYSVFTVAGKNAVTGGTGNAAVCPDVTNLRLSAIREGIVLRWDWPSGCSSVKIVRRTNTWPEGIDDPQAECFTCSRFEYMSNGEKYVDIIQQGQWKFYYTLYAQASGTLDHFFAPATDPTCRATIHWSPKMSLWYRLSSPDKGRYKGKYIHLFWHIENPFSEFSGFALIASDSEGLFSLDDGIEIFRWIPDKEGNIAGDHEAYISLSAIQQQRWNHFFCKAFVIDPNQRHTTMIIHPNTCIPISDRGEFQEKDVTITKQRYRFGIPNKVICPYCFEEFPLKQMLFDSYVGSEPVSAQYGLFDRLLRRPPRTPKNEYGQLLTRKLCPNHRHVLPFTAGTQENLIIGIIGAKFSGKSHYIAALVERLSGVVAADFHASLVPVTDETADRYQYEFYDPLFCRRLELPVTVGTPPPLIYDLYLDGLLWGEKRNRAVTLALYDTAGENFDKPDTVRQMVQYLKVASGIIFLIDPLQSQAVREEMPSSISLPDIDRMAEPYMVINRVLTELEKGKILMKSARLSTPVAVVLTKCDILRDSILIEANRLWNSDKRHIGYFDDQAHNDMTGMMGEYVRRWSLKAYNTVKTRFSRYAFFGVSATGCASDKDTRRFKYVSPWRVEDPLLWLLAELGVIPSK